MLKVAAQYALLLNKTLFSRKSGSESSDGSSNSWTFPSQLPRTQYALDGLTIEL